MHHHRSTVAELFSGSEIPDGIYFLPKQLTIFDGLLRNTRFHCGYYMTVCSFVDLNKVVTNGCYWNAPAGAGNMDSESF
jgi:hypothetical protein